MTVSLRKMTTDEEIKARLRIISEICRRINEKEPTKFISVGKPDTRLTF